MGSTHGEGPLSCGVWGLKLSPDSKLALMELFYSGEGSRAPEREPLKLFDLEAGREVRGFKGLSLAALDFLPNSKHVLGKAPDGTLTVWDVRTGDVLRTFQQGRGPIECLGVSPDGRYALTSGYSTGDLQCWDVPNGKVLWARATGGSSVTSFTFQPDGHLAFLGGDRAALSLWNIVEGKPVDSFDRRPPWGHRCAFSPDGKLLVADHVKWTLEDQEKDRLVLAEIPTGKEVREFAQRMGGAHTPGNADAIAFSDDGKHIVSVDADFMFRLWDVESGREIWALPTDRGGPDPVLSSDGKVAVYVSPDGISPNHMGISIKVWEMSKGQLLRELTIDSVP